MSDTLPHVIETTAETFERDVVERSRTVPVLVDIWAEWCQPCRRLGPLLERLAAEYDGRFVLVKVDSDRLPEIAGAFGVQSIPAVFAVKNAQIVDSFVGLQPESVIRAFIDRLLPGPSEEALAEAHRLAAGDPVAAEAKFREAVRLAPADPAPRIALAGFLLERDQLDEAASLIAALERRGFLEPEAEAIKAELTLRAGARDAGGSVDEARTAAEADPKNLALRFKLAEALAAAGQPGEALEIALDLVERDRHGVGEDARKLMIALFNLLPPDSELTTEYRRKLSLVL